ncbi:hypothetical protein DEAC_c43320 [Desulfosporosinus acididurans]|uniref:Uncharacterized protein n=1 Tax=Desulfosporosinus acididurans TaxID=476652 RepID=A0A0J1FJW6_9FIRM|nr:hypothetical protein [Desulfosporosinus acididurans]KLU63764.1 hypothetical protein DEAC_c43320 [Desulfosporosinus acididurans]
MVNLLAQAYVNKGILFLSIDMVIISVNLWTGNTVSFQSFYASENRIGLKTGISDIIEYILTELHLIRQCPNFVVVC